MHIVCSNTHTHAFRNARIADKEEKDPTESKIKEMGEGVDVIEIAERKV